MVSTENQQNWENCILQIRFLNLNFFYYKHFVGLYLVFIILIFSFALAHCASLFPALGSETSNW